ncbi:MAG: YbeD family protein [Pseudomonadales bacterium]
MSNELTGGDDAPRIEFPCAYPIKIIGASVEGFTDLVVSIVRRHDPDFDAGTVEHNDSRNGAYRSVRLTITATGESQLQDLFTDLKASGQVKMVL